jgi:hypothetical protein
MDPTTETPETLPPAILERLRRLDRAQPIVDPRTDRAVLDAARAYFRTRPQRAARGRRWAVPLAAAATLLLAAILMRPLLVDTGVPARDDIDGSGRVDILDVLALARERVARGDRAASTEARIDELAYRIVALDAPRSRP